MRHMLLVLMMLFTVIIPAAAQDEQLSVIASYNILGDVVAQVAGDAADVTTLMPLGANPHGFVPTPSDLTALADADVIFVNGGLFEEGLLEAIENAGDDMNIEAASACVPIRVFGMEADDDHDHEGDDHDHEGEHAIEERCEAHHAAVFMGDDHDHDHMNIVGPLYAANCAGHEGEGGDHAHGAGACDMHVWTNPSNVMLWTLQIRDTLSELDPANAETYAANAEAYLAELATLEEDLHAQVEALSAENRRIVTNHGTLGYFSDAYGFEVVRTIIPLGSAMAEPSSADIAGVIDTIRELEVPAIFAETTMNDDIARQIAEETGVSVHILYTGSLSEADGPASTYIDYMRYNIGTITSALGE